MAAARSGRRAASQASAHTYVKCVKKGISTVLRRFPVGAKMLIYPSISGVILRATHRKKALIKKQACGGIIKAFLSAAACNSGSRVLFQGKRPVGWSFLY